nr:hypothetical protein [Streptomyces sp. MH191]
MAGLVPQQVGDRLADPGGEAPRGETAVVPRTEVRGAEVRGAAFDAAGGGHDAVVQQGDLGELGPEVDDEQRAGEVGTGGEREGPDGVDREDGARAQSGQCRREGRPVFRTARHRGGADDHGAGVPGDAGCEEPGEQPGGTLGVDDGAARDRAEDPGVPGRSEGDGGHVENGVGPRAAPGPYPGAGAAEVERDARRAQRPPGGAAPCGGDPDAGVVRHRFTSRVRWQGAQ